jgi:tripartite-type tricarboxylate transporter receptor subunit TctC
VKSRLAHGRKIVRRLLLSSLILVAALACGHAWAQPSVESFYKGRTVDLVIGYSVGGGYDTYARVIARHLGKHIPGKPTIVPKNMPGAGSLKSANYLYQVAPKDGTVIATFARGMAMELLLGGDGIQFEADRFVWIGSANNEVSVCASWHTSPVKTWVDVLKTELIVGGTGSGADTDTFPIVLKNVLGAKLKLITGYPGGNDVALAMERGEVTGRCGWSWSSLTSRHGHWLKDNKISVFIQIALDRHPEISKDVPLVMDLARNDEQKQIMRLIFARQVMGRPYAAPPGIPADRAKALRDAFDATMKDKEFLAEAEKADLEIAPVTGAEIEKLIADIYRAPKDIAAKAAKAVAN